MDLTDPVHDFASRMMLEIVERQSQQPIEDVQTEPGVEPRADHGNDQTTGIAKQRFKGEDDRHHGGQEHERGNAVKLQNLVDRCHDQERRKYRENAHGQGSQHDFPQGCTLLQHDADEPAKIELRLGRDRGARRPQQHRLASPILRQAKFVHSNRGSAGRRLGIDEIDDPVCAPGAGHERRAAVFEQQDDRPAVVQIH